jgi:hypothetical protein
MAFKSIIIFGQISVNKWNDGVRSSRKLSKDGDIITREFATQAERDAYYEGIHDMNGWMDFQILENDEHRLLRN